MRQFSDQEKQLIYSIYLSKDSNSYVLTNAFKHWFYDIDEFVGYDSKNGCLVFDYEAHTDADSILEIQKQIIQTALLLKYLEDNGLIYIIEDSATLGTPKYIGKTIPEGHAPLSVALPQDIANIINRSAYRVYVSYALTQLVENDFKTQEELQLIASQEQLTTSSQQLSTSESQLEEARKQTTEAEKQTDQAKIQTGEAKKQTIKSTWTFVLSGLTFLASLIVPFVVSKCSGEDVFHESVINSIDGIDTILIESADAISNQLDTMVEFEKKNIDQNEKIIRILNDQDKCLKTIDKKLKTN